MGARSPDHQLVRLIPVPRSHGRQAAAAKALVAGRGERLQVDHRLERLRPVPLRCDRRADYTTGRIIRQPIRNASKRARHNALPLAAL